MARKSNRRRRAGVVAVPLGLLASALVVHQSSNAAFTASTSSAQESWTAGTVTLTDNSSTSLPWTAVTALKPGSTDTRCVLVTYNGTLSANIALYLTGWSTTDGGTSGSTNLPDQLQFTVKAFDGDLTSSAAGGCAAGTSSATDLLTPSVSSATANYLHTNYTNYSNGPKTGTVTPGSPSHYLTYQISYTVNSSADNGTQGDNVKFNFTWEAQNT